MQKLEAIAERVRKSFDVRTKTRDLALSRTRTLTRYCGNAIRAVHRDEREKAQQNLE
jgi:predicted translin family RNA/ssDNA-binding protein